MAACPYGSRSFNWLDPRKALNQKEYNMEFPTRMRGVVEKCNFCVERLAKDQMPACVEAAPQALAFGNLADPDSNVRQILRKRSSMRRKLELGTKPSVFYLV
jgi:Fe-S-cluster-containing dehydrogenase component